MSGYRWRGKRPERPLCLCGCGAPVSVATRTDRRYGRVKGKPSRYLHGHNPTDWSAGLAVITEHRKARAGQAAAGGPS